MTSDCLGLVHRPAALLASFETHRHDRLHFDNDAFTANEYVRQVCADLLAILVPDLQAVAEFTFCQNVGRVESSSYEIVEALSLVPLHEEFAPVEIVVVLLVFLEHLLPFDSGLVHDVTK